MKSKSDSFVIAQLITTSNKLCDWACKYTWIKEKN